MSTEDGFGHSGKKRPPLKLFEVTTLRRFINQFINKKIYTVLAYINNCPSEHERYNDILQSSN